MMVIQTPGSFLWAASLAARLGMEGWSTWGVYLITGCLQGCLLVMGISFEIKARRQLRQDAPHENGYSGDIHAHNIDTDDEGAANVEEGSNETSPLLNGSRKATQASESQVALS
jgi:hypothetical protein